MGKNKALKEKDKKIELTEEINEQNLFFSNRKTVKELIAPNGVNPNPLDHMVIHDNGIDVYTMMLYIDKLPTNSTFATTFAPLFNFPFVTSNVFINPMVAGKASRQLDKRVIVLDTERIAAEKDGDRNRHRKIMNKLQDAEAWATDIESGDNTLFEVSFLFVVQATDYDNLKLRVSDFHMRAKEKGIELMACYSVHPEAFLSSYPANSISSAHLNQLVKTATVKSHVFDKGSLCTIFNHTNSYFSHKDGTAIGHEISTGQLILWDNYDPSHDGFGVVVAGKTGSGKSAMVKMINSRNVDFDYVIRSIDVESVGSMGEYGLTSLNMGGINYQIKTGSNCILNLYDIDVEEEFDKITGTEYKALNLKEKMMDLKHLHITMVKDGAKLENFTDYTFLSRIVTDIIQELYEERGIFDGDIDSLYTTGDVLASNNRITSGKVKKKMPVFHEFYKKVLINQKENKIDLYEKPYQLLVASLKDYVREMYYCDYGENIKFFTAEEYQQLEIIENKRYYEHDGKKFKCVAIHGLKPYYDGQSTITATPDTTHINIDISQLPKQDKVVALLIAMSFMNENYIKKNSSNPKKAKKMVMLIDELHKTFPYEEARLFISDAYRTYRKRNVAPWSISQALADYNGYEDTKAIVKNSSAIFLFKQDYQDRAFLKEVTPLTDSQIERVLTLGGDSSDPEEKAKRRGECCLIDNGKPVFLKVDYLTGSEAIYVETDINKIKDLYKGELSA